MFFSYDTLKKIRLLMKKDPGIYTSAMQLRNSIVSFDGLNDYMMYKFVNRIQNIDNPRKFFRDFNCLEVYDKNNKKISKVMQKQVYTKIKECKNFLVFHEDVNNEIKKMVTFEKVNGHKILTRDNVLKVCEDIEDIDMPFPVCFFSEINNMSFHDTTSDITSDITSMIGSYTNMLVVESSPKKYDIFILLYGGSVEKMSKGIAGSVVLHNTSNDSGMKILIQALLNLMSKSEIAKSNKSFKVGIRNERNQRKQHVVKNFMIMRSKGSKHGESLGLKWKVSHRFDVCGFWRTLPNLKDPEFDEYGKKLPDMKRIGKDRQGNPKSGWTWVRPHVRGDDDKPYIKKTRIVT